MPELVQQESDQITLRRALDDGQGADRVGVVEGVHQAPRADFPPVHLPEEDDLRASDGQLRPGEGGLRLRNEALDQAEGELEAA